MYRLARRLTLIGAAAVVASGCGPISHGALGHIRGTFTLIAGPVPTCTGAPSCPSGLVQPEAQATITATRPDGTVAARTLTNSTGEFVLDVTAGTYTVAAPQQNEPGTYSAMITVAAGETVHVSLDVSEP